MWTWWGSYVALGVKQQLHSLKTLQVWQVHSGETDGWFSSGEALWLALPFFVFPHFLSLTHAHTHAHTLQLLNFGFNLNKFWNKIFYIFVSMLRKKSATKKENIFKVPEIRWPHLRHWFWFHSVTYERAGNLLSFHLFKTTTRCCVWYPALTTGRTINNQRPQRPENTVKVYTHETINHWFTAKIIQ